MAVYRRGKVWWYHFQFDGRHIQEAVGPVTRRLAEDAERKRRVGLCERRAGIERKPRPQKFEEYAREFLAWSQTQHRPKTWQLHSLNCATLRRYFSGRFLDEITLGMVEDFKRARSVETRRNASKTASDPSTVSAATVNRALTTLKLIYNHAAKCGLQVSNPVQGIKYLEEGAGRMRVVIRQEEFAYLQAASQPLQDIARVMLETGMRPEEVFRIEVANLDFQRRTVFNPFGKTPKARRTVSMTGAVWEILKQRALAARGRYVFTSQGDPNKPITTVRKAHNAALRRAAISPHFRLYDLRHTYASRAAMAGMDLPALAALLGHTKLQMTMRYVHPSEEHLRQAAHRVEIFNLQQAQRVAENAKESLQNPLQ